MRAALHDECHQLARAAGGCWLASLTMRRVNNKLSGICLIAIGFSVPGSVLTPMGQDSRPRSIAARRTLQNSSSCSRLRSIAPSAPSKAVAIRFSMTLSPMNESSFARRFLLVCFFVKLPAPFKFCAQCGHFNVRCPRHSCRAAKTPVRALFVPYPSTAVVLVHRSREWFGADCCLCSNCSSRFSASAISSRNRASTLGSFT